jgi:hypothetical protein
MRKSTLLVAFIAFVVLGSATAAGARTSPTINVTPSTGLTDGQVVSVTGTGLESAVAPGVLQCSAPVDPTSLSSVLQFCDADPFVHPTVDAAGNYTASIAVSEVILIGFGRGPNVDCTANDCVILAGGLGGTTGFIGVVAPISFGLPTPVTKDDCKRGGWRNFADDNGQPFRNQGDCMSFVAHHH